MKLTVPSIGRMSDAEAHDLFRTLRWAETGGEPVCPRCGYSGPMWELFKRAVPNWKCKEASCRHQFSVTSGTVFTGRKLPLRDLLISIALFCGGAKGKSANELSRNLGVQYKTAFIVSHKLREAIQRPDLCLDGIVEIDGCTVGGHRVYNNAVSSRQEVGRHAERVRLYQKHFDNRRVVVGIRQKHNLTMDGPGLTRCFVVKKESEAVDQVQRFMADDAVIHADMAHSWSSMKKLYRLLQVNHSQEYMSNEGVHTNNIESFWALLRKMHHGVHHRINAENLEVYANELAWRQDHRRLSEDERIVLLISRALNSPPSAKWKGYWQRHRVEETYRRRPGDPDWYVQEMEDDADPARKPKLKISLDLSYGEAPAGSARPRPKAVA